MLFTSSIVLALAAAVSAQNGTFTNGTSTSSAAPPAATAAGTAFVAGWDYVGCASPPSLTGLLTAFKGPQLTAELCASSCEDFAYFGLSGDNCFCTNQIQNGTTIVGNEQCSTPCPGNSNEACGRAAGAAPSSGLARRQALAGGALLSLYQQEIIPIGLIYVDINIVIFVDIDINIGVTVTNTYCETVTRTGCGCETKHEIPMTTVTKACNVCGPATSTVTLTLPTAAVSPSGCPGNCVIISGTPTGPSAVYPTGGATTNAAGSIITGAVLSPTVVSPTKSVFTGGAVATGVSGALALAAGVIALL